jgi:hypothetical protein
MTSVLFFGLPFWSEHLAEVLNQHTDDIRARYVPPAAYASLLARRLDDSRPVLVRMGFRPAARTSRGRAFEWYWRALSRRHSGAATVYYWLGTDLLHASRDAARWPSSRAALARTGKDLHLACAPWLVEELGGLDIPAELAVIPETIRPPVTVAAMPSDLTVLTYLPPGRFDFYGGRTIMAAAAQLPEVRFRVVGSTPDQVPGAPANVECLGWVTNMSQMYEESSVVVRIPEHDGYGGTVIEALLHGRYAVYTHEVPHVYQVARTSVSDLTGVLGRLRDRHLAGLLGPNMAGREYSLVEFAEDRLTARLASLLRNPHHHSSSIPVR